MDPVEAHVRRLVDQMKQDRPDLGVEVIDCDPDLADTAAFVEAYGFTLDQSANTIVIVGKSDPAVYVGCVVLANTRLDVNKVVRQRLGVKKCSFAPSEVTEELTAMRVGGVTPIGLGEYMPVWVDSRVMEVDQIVLGGGSRSCKVVGDPQLLTMLDNVEVVDELAKELPDQP